MHIHCTAPQEDLIGIATDVLHLKFRTTGIKHCMAAAAHMQVSQ